MTIQAEADVNNEAQSTGYLIVGGVQSSTNPCSNCLSSRNQMIVDKNVWINYLQTLEESCPLILFEMI